eukprot:TRINITY_DN417_c0_g4_i2.p1 TRINITY_DN417_c0_g4~~TRINITY_DN417_c0_g4_i2.p1  ORF type:complete len:101 (+),score=21.26 TRINITY_DN417_c0_g4_i2:67-369(+)
MRTQLGLLTVRRFSDWKYYGFQKSDLIASPYLDEAAAKLPTSLFTQRYVRSLEGTRRFVNKDYIPKEKHLPDEKEDKYLAYALDYVIKEKKLRQEFRNLP